VDRWNAMRVFVKVAEFGSFAEAGRQLNMSPPAVTRAIGALETMIGARLLTRTSRVVRLTESGSRYFEECQRILAEITAAEASAAGSHASPTGLLTVTAPVLFGQMHIHPIIIKYLLSQPGITAHTLYLDRNTNLIEEGIDVAVRIGALPDSDLQAVQVGTLRRVVCASPAYVEQHGEPLEPADLAKHRIVVASGASRVLEWRFGGPRRPVIPLQPALDCNLSAAAISAAISGYGITRVLSYQVDDAIRSGLLRELLSEFEPPPLPVHLVHAGGRHPPAKIRSFVDFAVAELRQNGGLRVLGP
jgi:DNA-binding transcriptional LysR family regulator